MLKKKAQMTQFMRIIPGQSKTEYTPAQGERQPTGRSFILSNSIM